MCTGRCDWDDPCKLFDRKYYPGLVIFLYYGERQRRINKFLHNTISCEVQTYQTNERYTLYTTHGSDDVIAYYITAGGSRMKHHVTTRTLPVTHSRWYTLSTIPSATVEQCAAQRTSKTANNAQSTCVHIWMRWSLDVYNNAGYFQATHRQLLCSLQSRYND